MSTLQAVIQGIQPLDEKAMAAARARQDTLTKPPGSLGRLYAPHGRAGATRARLRRRWHNSATAIHIGLPNM